MLDVMTQKSCAAYVFHRGRLGGNQTYFSQWQHFFIVPSRITRSFVKDDMSDPEGPLIRASIPPAAEPAALGPAAAAGPADVVAVVDPVFAATAARGEAAAAAAILPTPSSSAQVVDKGKRKLVMKPRLVPLPKGKDVGPFFIV
jgi:hypothetical protein